MPGAFLICVEIEDFSASAYVNSMKMYFTYLENHVCLCGPISLCKGCILLILACHHLCTITQEQDGRPGAAGLFVLFTTGGSLHA